MLNVGEAGCHGCNLVFVCVSEPYGYLPASEVGARTSGDRAAAHQGDSHAAENTRRRSLCDRAAVSPLPIESGVDKGGFMAKIAHSLTRKNPFRSLSPTRRSRPVSDAGAVAASIGSDSSAGRFVRVWEM